MKLPPKHDTWGRLLYRIACFFSPEPTRDCATMTEVERLAAWELRKVRPHKNAEGSEHLYAYGVYRAGEIIRKFNAQRNFDNHAATRARIPVRPLHRLPG